MAGDKSPNVRLSFVWASGNIAANRPTVYKGYLPIFAGSLNDENERFCTEAPEMFGVLGKRKSEFVRPYLERSEYIATRDEVSVVRIHAIKEPDDMLLCRQYRFGATLFRLSKSRLY